MAGGDVRAASEILWTSTADFDAGTKIASTPTPDYFIDDGVDLPILSPFNNPVAFYDNSGGTSRTYVVYQGGAGFLPIVTYYDHSAGSWAAPVQASNVNPIVGDGHGAPAILVGTDGFIHVVYGAHNTALKYLKSTSARDITAWTRQGDIDASGVYPHLFRDGTTLRIFYRTSTLIGGDWGLRNSTDGGATWGAEQTILDFGAVDTAYIGGSELRGSRITFSFVRYTNSDTFRYNVYACYYNTADGKIYSLAGTDLGITLNATEATNNCLIENTGTSQTYYSVLKTDSSNNPYVIYSSQVSGIWRQRWVYWTGSAWSSPVTIGSIRLDDGSGYSDLIVRSSIQVEAFLVSAGGTSVYDGDLERWTWDGSVWTRVETILTELRSGLGLNGAFVPISFLEGFRVLFAEFVPNTVAAHAKLYAWGSDGFVTSSLVPDRAVETETERQGIDAGTLELASLEGDAFAVADTDAETFRWDRVSGRPITGTDEGCRTVTRDISGGVLNLLANASTSTACRRGVRSVATLSGNWDIRVRLDVISRYAPAGLTTVFELQVLNEAVPYCADDVTVDGLLYQAPYLSGATDVFNAWTCTNGAFTQVGTNTVTPGDPISLRLTRSGNTFTWFYSTDGAAWTQDETTTNAGIANPVYVVMTVQAAADLAQLEVDLDDFVVSAGTVDAGGYRRSGSWSTPLQPYAQGTAPTEVVVAASGLTASLYLDSASVHDSAGTTLTKNDDNVVAGTQTTYTIPNPELVSQAWVARVTVAGDGSGTPVIHSVLVATRSPAPGPPNAIPFGCTSQYILPFKNQVRCVPDVDVDRRELDLRWYLDGVYVTNATVLVVVVDNPQPLVGTVWVDVALNSVVVDTQELRATTKTLALDYRANLFPYGFLFVLFAIALALVARPRILRSRTVVATSSGARPISTKAEHRILHARGIAHVHRSMRSDGSVRTRRHFGRWRD